MKSRNTQLSPHKKEGKGETTAVKVYLVDDHLLLRQGLAHLINLQPDLEVCGESDEVAEALTDIEKLKPDVVLVDITLKQSSGLELIKDIHIRWPKLPTIVVTMHDEKVFGERCLRSGASGYVKKHESIEKVIEAIRTVLKGNYYISKSLNAILLNNQLRHSKEKREDPVSRLSDREVEVFQLIGSWKGTREIAGELNISIKTVEYYRENIKKKLGLTNATDLVHSATNWVATEINEQP